MPLQGCETKGELRERARSARMAVTPADAGRYSLAICDAISRCLNGEKTVMVYVSKPPEVDTMPLIRQLLDRNTRVVVPIIERETRTLRLSFLEDPGDLVTSTFSVPEPIGKERPLDGVRPGVIIVPLLAFDRAGHRLGYGAGYYDRFLPRYPAARKIGAAYSCQETGSVPHDYTDVALDMIITEKEIICCH